MNTKQLKHLRHHPRTEQIGAYFVLLIICLLLSMIFFAEGHFPPYPGIDTRFAPDYSEAQFEQIKMGMSKADVLEKLGPPFNDPESLQWRYSEKNAIPFWQFAWLVREVHFDKDGNVAKTVSRTSPD